MRRKVFSLLFWLYLGVTSVTCFFVAVVLFILTTPFDRQRRVNHLWSCTWSSLYAYAYPGWRVRTVYRERIADDRAYVICANHTSIADIVLLFTLFKQFKWVSKRSNFDMPFVGWNMWMSGYIPLVRGDTSSTARMMARCKRALENGVSIMMFPEGTRSKDGDVRPFKRGAFTLAKECNVDVVPIAIHGGHALIPKHEATFATQAKLTVEVLHPVRSADYATEAELAEAVRQIIVARLAEQKEATPESGRVLAGEGLSAE